MKTTILATIAFYASNPGWQSFNPRCKVTARAIKRLGELGFLEISWETSQARFTGKVFV